MTRWWLSVALTAVCLGQAPALRAQYLPCPPSGGGSLPPEPAPFSLSEPANPGPLSPKVAPHVPLDCLGIPENVPGAFGDYHYAPEYGLYVHFGTIALQRQKLGHGPVAVIDPNANPNPFLAPNLDTGIPPFPPRSAKLALDFDDLQPHYDFGVKGSVGLVCDNSAIEFTGYYVPQNTSSVERRSRGQLDTLFNTFPVVPGLGFEGDNGIGLQDDRVRIALQTAIGNAEVNYRWWNKALTGAELILGVRYVDLHERLSVLLDDDGQTVIDTVTGMPDPLRIATYSVRAHSHIVAPQVGFEYQYCCNDCLVLGCVAKAAFGVDFYEQDVTLVRGDGLVGLTGHQNNTQFSHLYELGGFIDWYFCERMRVRMGYQALWLVNVLAVVDSVDFNLGNPNGRLKEDGSIFFHGPMVELQFFF
jgi:hypothetical protein